MSGETLGQTQGLDVKREELFAAAEAFVAERKTEDVQRRLCDAASAYQLARAQQFKAQYGAPDKSETNGPGAKYKMPFGRTQGTPIGEVTKKDLEWVLPKLKESLSDPKKARFREKDSELVAAIERELETR